MEGSSNRFVVIISALLTLFVLGAATLAVGFRNGWLHVATDPPSRDAVTALAQPADPERSRTLPAGREANQTAQPQVASCGAGDRLSAEHDGDDDRERGSRGREPRHD